MHCITNETMDFEAERNPSLKVELRVKDQDVMIVLVILSYKVPCLEENWKTFGNCN